MLRSGDDMGEYARATCPLTTTSRGDVSSGGGENESRDWLEGGGEHVRPAACCRASFCNSTQPGRRRLLMIGLLISKHGVSRLLSLRESFSFSGGLYSSCI